MPTSKKTAKPSKKATKVVKPATVRPKVTKTAPRKKTPPAKPQEQPEPPAAPVETTAPAPVEEQPPQPQVFPEIPPEGNNIASVQDRAHADTHPANFQPPVEKTFVSPPDNPSFTGTVGGQAFTNSDVPLRIEAQSQDTLRAIPYTVTAGTLTIVEVR